MWSFPPVKTIYLKRIQIYRFDLSSPKMIFAPADAQLSKDIGEDDEDVVNQVRLTPPYLARTEHADLTSS